MRYVVLAGLALLNFILTGAVFPYVHIAGIYPDILLCMMVSMIIVEKNMGAAYFGMFGGLLLDIVYASAIGFFALPYLATGVMFYYFRSSRYFDAVLLPALSVLVMYMIKELISCVIVLSMGIAFDFWIYLVRYVLPGAAFSAAAMVLVHFWMTRLLRKRVMLYKGSAGIENLQRKGGR